jgi:uncharacterized protein (DUF362 family)
VTDRFTRRELPILIGGGALLGATRSWSASVAHPGLVATSEVRSDRVTAAACRQALETAVGAATRAESAKDGLGRLFRPSDVVGIKLNCLAGPRMSPHPELVNAMVDMIAELGISRNRIIVFERSSRELERARFSVRRSGGPYLCFGTDNDYDRYPSDSGSIGSCFARLVSTTCTALISFGVVKDHDLAGVSGSLKNWYGVIHNPNKYHDSGCDPYVADVVNHQFLRDKIRLTVLDGIEAQCHGGPAFYQGGVFPLGRVAVSTDTLAADLWAWQQIDHERHRRGRPTLEEENRAPRFIATAARYGLGVGNPKDLQQVKT